MVRYNEEGVKALDKVHDLIQSFNLPFAAARKFNAIMDAIEIQVEDCHYSPAVIDYLCESILALADQYELKEQRAKLEAVLTAFGRDLEIWDV
ncbi:hypothetical protein M1O56_03695 [Dehalococcoidia bacterium]|nr:hypothetical protein [Dehalococcoidia bacterium]